MVDEPRPYTWDAAQLSELVRAPIKNGIFVRREQFGKGTLFLNVADIYRDTFANLSSVERVCCSDQDREAFALTSGDVIFVRSSLKRDGIGQCCAIGNVPENAVFDCHLMRVRPDPERLDPAFLAYFAGSRVGKKQLIALSKTTTMTTLNQEGLGQLAVLLPPIPEQRAIAHVLRSVQRAKEATEKVIAATKQLKQSALSHFFTYGSARLAESALVQLVDTDIGKMPSHWQLRRFDELFDSRLGKMLSQASKTGTASRLYIRNANVQWGHVNLDNLFEMDFNERERQEFRLRPGDVLICEGGEVGRTAVWSGGISECYYQKAIHRARPRDGRASPEFLLYHMMNAFLIRRSYGVVGTDTTIAHLPGIKLKTLLIPLPPRNEQDDITTSMAKIEAKLSTENSRKYALDALFTSLLHNLMTGKLRVNDLQFPDAARS